MLTFFSGYLSRYFPITFAANVSPNPVREPSLKTSGSLMGTESRFFMISESACTDWHMSGGDVLDRLGEVFFSHHNKIALFRNTVPDI